jgi:hypothetical protein
VLVPSVSVHLLHAAASIEDVYHPVSVDRHIPRLLHIDSGVRTGAGACPDLALRRDASNRALVSVGHIEVAAEIDMYPDRATELARPRPLASYHLDDL